MLWQFILVGMGGVTQTTHQETTCGNENHFRNLMFLLIWTHDCDLTSKARYWLNISFGLTINIFLHYR
jgi:hypothetical protein